ncbi:MAG: alpha/beta family hydrolase [Hyphomonadaceae bacterium]
MSSAAPASQAITIPLEEGRAVSGLYDAPGDARALFVCAHGAGAGMTHKGMAAVAAGLAARGVAVLRYNFAYMEQGSKRPDAPPLAHAAVRAAVAVGQKLALDLPLIAGGRSFGGRMTSQAQAEAPLPGVRGLAFLGFPLHPAGKPGIARAAHLMQIAIPMFFLQGARDALAEMDLLRPVVAALAPRATLQVVEGGDHSFRTPARAAKPPAAVEAEWLDALAAWILRIARA